MIGAIEFLRKAKEICKVRHTCYECPAYDLCRDVAKDMNEANLVRKVMDYEIVEEKDAERM